MLFPRINRASPLAKHMLPRTGAAMAEFAVVLPVLTVLMLGMIEMTRALQVKNYLADAARSGCRIGVQPATPAAVPTNPTLKKVTDRVNAVLTSYGIPISSPGTTIKVQVGDLTGTVWADWTDME